MVSRTFCYLLLLAVTGSPMYPQTEGRQSAGLNACQLLPKSEVDRVTGRKSYADAEPIRGSGCGYAQAQLLIYSGDKAEENWEGTMKTFGHDKAQRFPIPGVGEKAYSFYPKPRDQYEDTNAFVVVKQGRYIIVMSVAAPQGATAQSVQPQALELSKAVLAKLK